MKARDLILPHFKSHWRTIGIGLLSLIVVDFAQLMIPRAIKWAIDDLTDFAADFRQLAQYAGAVVAIALFIGCFRYIWRRCLLGTARRLEETLRNRLLQHVQTLSMDYFKGVKTGELMAHATNDIQQVRMAAGMGLVAFNDAVVLGAAAVGFMLYIDVRLTLYVLIPMPLIILTTRILGRRMHHRYQNVQASFAEMTETIRERCAGIRMVKAHHSEAAAGEVVRKASQQYIDENIKLVGVTGLMFPLMLLLTNLSLALVLLLGGRSAILGQITAGDLVAFISYLNLLAWPMMALGWVTNMIQRGGASLERLKTIMQRRSSICDDADAKPLVRTNGRIAFEKVWFAYDGQWILKGVEARLEAGQTLGIVGPPGSGKSTLLSLVPRLYDVQHGRVTIDGIDVRDIKLADLRRQMVFVPQEPFLFAGTLRDNILFGLTQASESQVDKALAEAGLVDTIAAMPSGLDTVVGEKGILLSGGQKQRVALARALLIDAPIVLLDDPISQVDTATGQIIIDAIRRMAGRKTIIIVSHRLAAVRFADRIISFEKGSLIESGSHDELLDNRGYYAGVFALQELEDAV
jgi:ATP-binding cassette subfamily B protein